MHLHFGKGTQPAPIYEAIAEAAPHSDEPRPFVAPRRSGLKGGRIASMIR
jgi:hypothetical protein